MVSFPVPRGSRLPYRPILQLQERHSLLRAMRGLLNAQSGALQVSLRTFKGRVRYLPPRICRRTGKIVLFFFTFVMQSLRGFIVPLLSWPLGATIKTRSWNTQDLTYFVLLFQLTNNRRSDFCQPSPDSSPYTANENDIAEVAGFPFAVIILISALALVVTAILTALGICGLRKWKGLSVVPAPPAVQGWINFDYLIRSHLTCQLLFQTDDLQSMQNRSPVSIRFPSESRLRLTTRFMSKVRRGQKSKVLFIL